MNISRALAICGPLSLTCLAASGFAACSSPDATPVARKQSGLIADQPYFPTTAAPRRVQLCWDRSSTLRFDFAVKSREVRRIANESWPVVANVEFVGWDKICEEPLGFGVTRLILMDGTELRQPMGDAGLFPPLLIPVSHPAFAGGLIPHQLGHVLGFKHEDGGTAEPTCPGDGETDWTPDGGVGTAALTPTDQRSIMRAAGICNPTPTPSNWDAIGAMQMYGPRTTAVRPLVTGYRPTMQDHLTQAVDVWPSQLSGNPYIWRFADGWLFAVQVPGTVPLQRYWHPGRTDYVTVATAETRNVAVAAGYQLDKTEGYVYPTPQPGTVPLDLYWSDLRLDHFSTTTDEGRNAALAAGYYFVRTEGYVFREPPYHLGWKYRHDGRQDYLLTAGNSPLAASADAAGYQFVGFDHLLLRYSLPGTTPLRTWWSGSREDHFATATSAGDSSAMGAGYVRIADQGHVFTAPLLGGLYALKSFWNGAAGDNFTSANSEAAALASGYTTVRIEGWVLPTQPPPP